MHWEVHQLLAVLCGLGLAGFAAVPRLNVAERAAALIGGGVLIGYGAWSAQETAGFRLSPLAFALPVIGMLWLLGSLRAPAASAVRHPGHVDRAPDWFLDDAPHPDDDLMSPALWAALPPAPVSPAVGMPVRAPLAPPERSLFMPAAPLLPSVPPTQTRAGICERCGSRREAESNFCSSCGRAFTANGGFGDLPELVRVEAPPAVAPPVPPAQTGPESIPAPPSRMTLKEEYRLRNLRGEY